MTPHAYIVAGLAFGDEGKGSAVDFLARHYDATLVVRYNGGPQAAHNVVLPDGRHHTFAQFGSGYLNKCMTYLSHHMMVEPFALFNEAKTLEETFPELGPPLYQMLIDEDCPVITPYHWLTNRHLEVTKGWNKHGSCGMGVGETRADLLAGRTILYVRDLVNRRATFQKLKAIKAAKIAQIKGDKETTHSERLIAENANKLARTYVRLAKQLTIVNRSALKSYLRKNITIFEGAQGVLLDEIYGFAPNNTWSNTTFGNAHDLLHGLNIPSTRIGVMRTYMTRHGIGPFPTQYSVYAKEPHNVSNEWQGGFQTGILDFPLLQYAIRAVGHVDELFVTHLDNTLRRGDDQDPFYVEKYPNGKSPIPFGVSGEYLHSVAVSWADVTTSKDNLIDVIEKKLGAPVRYTSSGPTYKDKQIRQPDTEAKAEAEPEKAEAAA